MSEYDDIMNFIFQYSKKTFYCKKSSKLDRRLAEMSQKDEIPYKGKHYQILFRGKMDPYNVHRYDIIKCFKA